ncbi:MAG: DinB family protein [Bdellovibrionota bacterium]
MSALSKASDSFYELSATWENILSDCSELSESQLSKKIDATTWSLLEIIEHCVLVEEVVYKTLSQPALTNKISSVDRLKPYLVKFLLSLPIKVKIPTQRVAPSGVKSFKTLKTEVTNRLTLWNNFFHNLDESKASGTAFNHPIFGNLDLPGTFSFLVSHLRKHAKQLENRKKLAHKLTEY